MFLVGLAYRRSGMFAAKLTLEVVLLKLVLTKFCLAEYGHLPKPAQNSVQSAMDKFQALIYQHVPEGRDWVIAPLHQ